MFVLAEADDAICQAHNAHNTRLAHTHTIGFSLTRSP